MHKYAKNMHISIYILLISVYNSYIKLKNTKGIEMKETFELVIVTTVGTAVFAIALEMWFRSQSL